MDESSDTLARLTVAICVVNLVAALPVQPSRAGRAALVQSLDDRLDSGPIRVVPDPDLEP